jgi:Ca2+-binding RTX toxin-like protein
MAISTNGLQLARIAGAVFNQQLSASDYSEILAANKTAAELDAWANAAVAAEFRNKTTTDIAKAVLANVGLSSVAGLEAWVAGQLTAGGGVAKAGATMISLLNDYSNMTADATYGAAATTFNQKAANSQALSQTAGTATGTYANVSTAVPSTPFTLTTGVDLKTTGAGADTFTSVNPASSTATLTAGDNIDGGAGNDTLAITSSAAMSLGAGVTMNNVESISVSASGGALTLDTALMTGVTSVANSGSTDAVSITGLKVLVPVSVTATSANTTVGFASAVAAGAADAITVNINGVGTSVITTNGFETINVASSGSASGGSSSSVNGTTVASTTLNTLNVTGTAAAKLVADLVGANAATTGTVTSDDGAHDVDISGRALTDKLSVSMMGGNDTVRVSTVAATHTIAGGDGTDTLRYSGTAAVALAATANVTGIETVTLSGATPTSFAMTGAGVTTVNYLEAGAGTFGGLSTGGTVNLNKGGSVTVAAAGAAATATSAATLTAATYSGTADSLTVNVGTATTASGSAASTVSAVGVESVTFNSLAASGATEARSIILADTTATTAALKSITVTNNIQAATTVAVSNTGTNALTTVNLSGVAGGASFTGGSTAGTSITGGAGIDTLTGGAGPDVIIGGEGNDTLAGMQGADTLTGGAGNDTFTIGANSAVVGAAQTSGATLTDTITDFTSGTDKLNLAQAGSFLGNFANYTAGAAATSGSGVGANQAFYSVADSTVYVLATAGTLAATDTMVKLSNAPATLAAGDLNFGTGGNTIALTAAGSTVSVGTATTNTTTYNDIITTTAAFLSTSTIDGGVGSGDTLTITDAVAAPTFVLSGTAATAPGAQINNIEIINLNLGSTGTVTIPTLTTGSLVVNNAHASNASTVVLGAQTPQIAPLITGTQSFVSVSTGIDTVTAGATAQSISTGGGDDVVNIGSQAIFFGGTYNGGAGTNDVLNVTLAATQPISFAAAAVAGGAALATGFEVINVAQNNANSTVTIVPDAAVTVNFTDAAAAAITVTGTGGAVTVNAGAIQSITVNGTGNVTVGGTNTTGAIIFSANKTAGTNSVVDSANAHTITNTTVSGVVNVNSTAQTGVTTLAGVSTGGFVVTNLIAAGGIITSTAAGPVSVTGTSAQAHTVTGGAGIDTVTITGATTGIQTIDTNGGNDIVTLSLTGGANVVTLGDGNDTYLAGAAGGSVTGGLGSDSMTGGAGTDVFIYGTGDSGGVTTDTITGLAFGTDIIRLTASMTSTGFAGTTTTATTVGFNSFNATTGAITILTDDGSMTINTASSTNAPSATGSLSTLASVEYYITGTNGVDTITTGAGNDSVNGGQGADTITVGSGDDTIVGGVGGDTISVGSGTDVVIQSALGHGGTLAMNGATINSISTSGLDRITGFAAGDTLRLAQYTVLASTATEATAKLISTVTTQVITGVLGTATVAGNSVGTVRGNFNPTNDVFVGSATGTDLIFMYDGDGATGSLAVEGIVLIGAGALTPTVALVTGGLITFV